MAKARAIVKRRKTVRNIRKITKTMQMIATVKFQKSLKRALGTKAYTAKVRELVDELAGNLDGSPPPLLRGTGEGPTANRIGLITICSDRGLAGAYNGTVLRASAKFMREQESAGKAVDLYVSGKRGVSYFNFRRRPITQRYDDFADMPKFDDVARIADDFIEQFTEGKIDAVHVAYMRFISASNQQVELLKLLPMDSLKKESGEAPVSIEHKTQTVYDFYPDSESLLNEVLPLSVKTSLFQAFLDATTSENVARMVAMKSATDNADKMAKLLTMQYNRARQSQITTELSEIMGGVEAMKA